MYSVFLVKKFHTFPLIHRVFTSVKMKPWPSPMIIYSGDSFNTSLQLTGQMNGSVPGTVGFSGINSRATIDTHSMQSLVVVV